MAVRLLLGDTGVGKTHTIYKQLIKESIAYKDKNLVLIVPEQFTLKTQQDLINMHKNNGIMNIEVLSFGRLAYRIYDDLMVSDKSMLGETGKAMIIRKILTDHYDEYKVIAKNAHRKGYVVELQEAIKEVFQYNISHDDFDKIGQEVKSPLICDKMEDLRRLYTAFNAYIEGKYITTETTMHLLAESIQQAKYLENARVYIDGFYGFTPIQYKIMTEIFKKCEQVLVAITVDVDKIDDENITLFNESKKAINKIREICNIYNIACDQPFVIKSKEDVPYRYKENKAIYHIQKNIFRFNEVKKIKSNRIYMAEAKNSVEEIQYVADSILELVMNQGYRYRDIAVLSGDIAGYDKVIQHQFESYKIPYFIDTKREIKNHPFIELINNLLAVHNDYYSYESVMKYFKNVLHGGSEDELDLLENYGVAYGINSKKKWLNKWGYSYPYLKYENNEVLNKDIISRINELKDSLFVESEAFYSSITKDSTVKDICVLLYNYIENMNIFEKLKILEKRLLLEGQIDRSLEYAQIYKVVLGLLEQMVDILGDMPVSIREFTELFESGLLNLELKIVPPSFDQVNIGDIERSRFRDVKALFIIGLNEGKIPKTSQKTGFLTDKERIRLGEIGIELAPDNITNIFKEQLFVYMTMFRCKKRLYISCVKGTSEGASVMPSTYFYAILNMFKGIKIINLEKIYNNKQVINHPKPTLNRMIKHIARNKAVDDQFINTLYWYYKSDQWHLTINELFLNNHEDKQSKIIYKDIIEKIYGKELSSSISRLELFASCPFAHYVKYGLDLNDRILFEVGYDHIGILLHETISRFFEIVDKKQLSFQEIEDDVVEEIVNSAIIECVRDDGFLVFNDTNRTKNMVERLKKVAIRSIKTVLYQINKGDFNPTNYEYKFNSNDKGSEMIKIPLIDNYHMNIKGQIDRIDEFETDDTVYMSVVDYKSSHKDLDLSAVYNGLQLQLLVYLNTVIKLKKNISNKEVLPAAALYYYMNNPIINGVTSRDSNAIEKQIREKLKLNGIVLSDMEIINHLDHLLESKSDVIPVSVKKDGKLSAFSSVITEEQFVKLQAFIECKMTDLGREIVNGNVDIKPYKYKTKKGCDYCEYHSICRFEQGIYNNQYKEMKKYNKDEIWEKIEEDIKCSE